MTKRNNNNRKFRGCGFDKLTIENVERKQQRTNKIPNIAYFVLGYFDKTKKLTLHPTKGYRLQSI